MQESQRTKQMQNPQSITTIECPVCLEMSQQQNILIFCQNKHKICRKCLINYTQAQINTSFKLISCPHGKCQHILTQNCPIFLKIPEILQEKYKKVIMGLQQIKKNLRYCPTCRKELKNDEDNKNFFCTGCNKKLCKQCLNTAHQFRGKCQINVLFELKIKFKQCPNCRFIVQKNQGCDHMICLCGHQFCYQCGKNRFSYTAHTCQRSERKFSE